MKEAYRSPHREKPDSSQKDFGARRPAWGFCDHPLVDGERVICSPFTSNASIAALNKQTHQFEMPGVTPDKTFIVESKEDGDRHRIFLWTTPLKKEPAP